MKLEILMSVMHQTNFDIAYKSKVKSDLLIINQCDKDGYDEIIVDGYKWRMIYTKERGLSKSRNMALENAVGDICLLSDDDEVFEDNYMQNILNAYRNIPLATAIVFNVTRINFSMKKTYYRIKMIRKAPKYRGYQSGMVTFKLSDIKTMGIKFDEHFGSGTHWGGGEEILFERDIRRNNGKIFEHPFNIAVIDYGGGSQWFKGYDEKYFYNLGAFLYYSNQYRISGMQVISIFYTCFYKLKKEKTLSSFSKLLWIIRGMRGIKKGISYNNYIIPHK